MTAVSRERDVPGVGLGASRSPDTGRIRLFDHDEAYARVMAGESHADVAKSYGVSSGAVYQLMIRHDPGRHERQKAYHRDYQREHFMKPCIGGCGRLAWHHGGRDGMCRRCRGLEAAETVRPDTLRCSECGQWKPDEDFPHRNRTGARRQRHSVCRPCQATARQRSREARKVPCVRCGTPRLHTDDRGGKGKTTRDTGLCVRCYRETRGQARA